MIEMLRDDFLPKDVFMCMLCFVLNETYLLTIANRMCIVLYILYIEIALF